MSWAEIFKINTNMKRPLNEQLRDMNFRPMRIITSTGTYTPEKTGKYMVICVGAGGDGIGKATSASQYGCSGGGGGVAIKTLTLSKSTAYNVTVGTTASFTFNASTIITATSGSSGSSSAGGTGGTASGGDSNYAGTSGSTTTSWYKAPTGGSVGVAISELTCSPAPVFTTLTRKDTGVSTPVTLQYGDSILYYGGGGTGAHFYNGSSDSQTFNTTGKPAAVIIVPLEMEE